MQLDRLHGEWGGGGSWLETSTIFIEIWKYTRQVVPNKCVTVASTTTRYVIVIAIVSASASVAPALGAGAGAGVGATITTIITTMSINMLHVVIYSLSVGVG